MLQGLGVGGKRRGTPECVPPHRPSPERRGNSLKGLHDASHFGPGYKYLVACARRRADDSPAPLSPASAERAHILAQPDAFQTLVNPACSHCVDEAKRRANELKPADRLLAWTRGYSNGGAIPFRFFLNTYRVISDSYGVFVHDPDAGFARGFAPSYEFSFYGWRHGVMVMKHKDCTLFSCLSGLAFAGPRKGTRLDPLPTLVSDWGFWLEKYPGAVAYHMFDKYQPHDVPVQEHVGGVQTRAKVDPRLDGQDLVLGVWPGKTARAYLIKALEKAAILEDSVDGQALMVFWEPKTRSAAAYKPIASPPRKYSAPQPGPDGTSLVDPGVAVPQVAGSLSSGPRRLSFIRAENSASGPFMDLETKSIWDVAGRCSDGALKGWTLEWIDSVQVKWFAWAAEYPQTEIYQFLTK